MRLAAVMDEVAAKLGTIGALKSVVGWPVGSVSSMGVPGAVVSYPESWNPHAAYARGAEEIKGLVVVVVVGRASERASRDLLSEFINDVVTALESGGYTACDELTVSNIDFDTVRIGETDHIAAVFDCDIVGSGR